MERFIRKITKTNRGSILVRLPTKLVNSLGWRKKQKIAVSKKGGAIVLRDARKRRSD